jgi:putative membrane protein
MLGIKRLGVVAATLALTLAPAAAAHAEGAQPSATPSQQDSQFLQQFHQFNLAVIAVGNAAQQRSSNQQVKDVAARFVTDQTQLDQAVQQTASTLGVSLPGTPTADQQATADRLQTLNGQDFDTLFVTSLLNWHTQAIQVCQTEVSQGSNAQAKKVAQDALAVLQAHHDALVALAQSLGIPVPTATPSPGATTGTPSPGATTGTPSPGATTETPSPGATTETPSPGATTETPSPGATAETPGPATS